jgi:hypothetical protein
MTVWILLLMGRSFGHEVRVFDSEHSAVCDARESMDLELKHWKIEAPDREEYKPDTPDPYYAALEDGLSVYVYRREVKG